MFKLITEGSTVAMTEVPTYIRRHQNGCFVLCVEPEAEGIAHGGTVYHLLGRADIAGAQTVMLERVDSGAEIKDAQGAIDNLVVAILSTDTTMGTIQSAIDDLVIATLEGGTT